MNVGSHSIILYGKEGKGRACESCCMAQGGYYRDQKRDAICLVLHMSEGVRRKEGVCG